MMVSKLYSIHWFDREGDLWKYLNVCQKIPVRTNDTSGGDYYDDKEVESIEPDPPTLQMELYEKKEVSVMRNHPQAIRGISWCGWFQV